MLNSLTALSLCQIALGQITAAAASEVDQKSGKKKKKCTSLTGLSTQLQTRESNEGLELTSFSPTRVPLKRLQVGRRYPSSTSLVLNGAKQNKKPQLMTRGGQDLLKFNPFTVLLGSFRCNVVHAGALSRVCLLLFFSLLCIPLLHFMFSPHFYSVVTQISKPKELRLQGRKRGENQILIIHLGAEWILQMSSSMGG